MTVFYDELRRDLDELGRASLRRSLRLLPGVGLRVAVAGKRLLNLASNDYLGLAGHPRVKAGAIDAIERCGAGAGASRLVAGHLDLHAQVEQRLTALKTASPGCGSLLLPTGYMANLAVLTALAGPGDLVCVDKLVHASLIDAARSCGAAVRSYPHLQTAKLERLLARHRREHEGAEGPRRPRRFIVTDSIFSMDGDAADLPALADLARRHEAVLVVDEAHATGVLGEHGAGLAELQGAAGRVDISISTASKGLGSLGGIVTARQEVIDTLVNRGRPMIYTTGAMPAQAGAILAALDVVRDEPWRRQRVLALSAMVRDRLTEAGWLLPATTVPTPIVPLVVAEAAEALSLADRLREAGILAVAIRPPTVPPGSARVRISLRADLEDADVEQVLAAIGKR
ncbi:MAG: aminotransferase class I/II-fold pyridoxal phosphate-dependent enzyme [Phycisphaeraceae bacterium]